MAGIEADPTTIPDDWWLMRTDALTSVRVAFNMNKEEAEQYLVSYACSDPSFEWRYQRRFTVGESVRIVGGYAKKMSPGPPPSPEKRRARIPDFKDIDTAIRTVFWRQVRNGLGRAENNSASYAGLVFLAAPSAAIGINDKFETAQNVVVTDSRWWIEIYVSAIQFRAAPLIANVQSNGGLVGIAIEHLRSLGRLPPSVSAALSLPTPNRGPASKPEPEPVPQQEKADAPVKHRGKSDRFVEETLRSVSAERYSQAGYAEQVLLPRGRGFALGTLKNALSRVARQKAADGSSLWKGLPPPKRRWPSP